MQRARKKEEVEKRKRKIKKKPTAVSWGVEQEDCDKL